MSVGPAEILVILIVALLVFGPQRLPEVGRQVGAAVRELRKMQDSVRGELDMVLHPEHGTRSSDTSYEPGDHSSGPDYSFDEPPEPTTIDIEPVEPAAIDPPDAISSNGSSGPGDAVDGERRFITPPDSFI